MRRGANGRHVSGVAGVPEIGELSIEIVEEGGDDVGEARAEHLTELVEQCVVDRVHGRVGKREG